MYLYIYIYIYIYIYSIIAPEHSASRIGRSERGRDEREGEGRAKWHGESWYNAMSIAFELIFSTHLH